MENEKILKEIDEMHKFANDALGQKRFDDYMNIFSDNLTYKQLNGKIIDKKQLTKDTAFYFSRIKTSQSQYKRKDYSIEENRFTENLTQIATTSIKIFLVFTKKWTVERDGMYKWIKTDNNWQIEKVEILNEKIY